MLFNNDRQTLVLLFSPFANLNFTVFDSAPPVTDLLPGTVECSTNGSPSMTKFIYFNAQEISFLFGPRSIVGRKELPTRMIECTHESTIWNRGTDFLPSATKETSGFSLQKIL
mmetsp:Transcript_3949/g.9661  ORF Transcript_3949/g.9661 Transcript_3949/m.9661 type:complete len:113 (+) Transcript_3949:1524-1862(+)